MSRERRLNVIQATAICIMIMLVLGGTLVWFSGWHALMMVWLVSLIALGLLLMTMNDRVREELEPDRDDTPAEPK